VEFELRADDPASYTEHRVGSGSAELRYLEAGTGEPLVWLHGGFGLHPSSGTDLLTQRFRVIAIELPGFGVSVGLNSANSFDELSEQVAMAIEGLGLAQYVLHGTSFGGATALHVALNHPEQMTGLVLESPVAFRPLGWTPPDFETVRRGLLRHPERARRVKIDPDLQRQQREFVNRLSMTVDRAALAARLRELQVPALVMFGEYDTLAPPELAGMYCDAAPNCSSALIADAAHVISSDQPEAYATAVCDFVARG
jgi:pimeloyl-ACP methyl ester carboxylesterase